MIYFYKYVYSFVFIRFICLKFLESFGVFKIFDICRREDKIKLLRERIYLYIFLRVSLVSDLSVLGCMSEGKCCVVCISCGIFLLIYG